MILLFLHCKTEQRNDFPGEMQNLKQHAGSTYDIQACTWDPKHPLWCSKHFCPFFSKMAYRVQAPPTIGAMSLGVSVLFSL